MTTCRHDSIGRRIYLTSQAIRTHVDQLLKPFDITMEQFHILKTIERQHRPTQSALCEMTGKSPANITRILDRLAKKKLIVRRDNPADRRSQLVLLTGEGAGLAARMSALFSHLSIRIENNIDTEDMAVVNKVLGQIEANLRALSKDIGD